MGTRERMASHAFEVEGGGPRRGQDDRVEARSQRRQLAGRCAAHAVDHHREHRMTGFTEDSGQLGTAVAAARKNDRGRGVQPTFLTTSRSEAREMR